MGTHIKNGKVYVILSGKGGVGKTVSAINLGSIFNSLGKEVIVADANFSTPNIGLSLGSPIVPVTLNHALNNKARVEEAIYEHESGTKILPSSIALADLNKTNYSRFPDIAKRLRKIADIIVVDSAAGLGDEAKIAIKSADEIIIITNPEMSAVTDALKAIKLSEQLKKNVNGVIVTRYTGDKIEMDIPTIYDMLETPILGVVPEDIAIKESQKMKNAVVHTHPQSKSAKAYHEIAKRILGSEYLKHLENIEGKTEGFFRRLWKKLGF